MQNTLHRKKLVIVGCGAAATLLLAELSINTVGPFDINIIDDNPASPLGIAYAVNHPSFVLNVAAKRMGAYVSKPDDFYQWLLHNPEHWRNLHPEFSSANFGPDDFVPRMIYAVYLRQVFAGAIEVLKQKGVRVTHLSEQVIEISPVPGAVDASVYVRTHQQKIRADIVVFATGNNPTRQITVATEHSFNSPYTPEFLSQEWSALSDVAVIGSGLSMIDLVQFISSQGFTGNFHIFSRHGLLPLPHSTEHPMAAAPPLDIGLVGNTAVQAVRALRFYVESNSAAGFEWQESINKIRPHVSNLWAKLSHPEQRRLAKALPWWNIHRHRIPPSSYAVLQRLRERNRLHVTRCCIKGVDRINNGFQLHLDQSLAVGNPLKIAADRLVFCNGYAPGFNRVKKLGGELLSPDEYLRHWLIKSDATFRISFSHPIFALGPALSGLLFESTALHETRQQANSIAAAVSLLLHQQTSDCIETCSLS